PSAIPCGAPPPPRGGGRSPPPLRRRDRIAISTAVAPQVRAVLATYCSGPGIEIGRVRAALPEGGSRLPPAAAAAEALDESVACLVAQQPNFFGGLEPMRELGD